MNNEMCDNERILVSFNDEYIKELTDFVCGFKRISKEERKFALYFCAHQKTMSFIRDYAPTEGRFYRPKEGSIMVPFTEATNIPDITVDVLDRCGSVLKREIFHDCLINKLDFSDDLDLIIIEFTYRDEELEDATTNEETNNEKENG